MFAGEQNGDNPDQTCPCKNLGQVVIFSIMSSRRPFYRALYRAGIIAIIDDIFRMSTLHGADGRKM